jgi:signal transduction histidine kinase
VLQVAPALHSVYLYRRLRSRAGAVERGRVAREMHDGVIQSLIAVDLRLQVLKGTDAPMPHAVARELDLVQSAVREEVLNLRDLMQQVKPRDIGPRQLVEHMFQLVDRFRRDTGIEATFLSDLQEVPLAPQARRELAGILHEALINVRKHSGATHVVARLTRQDDDIVLVVDDDGRGYGFEGRFSQAELDMARRGPLVIKERARTSGGRIAVESSGRGSRLEVLIPVRAGIRA